MPFIRLPDSDDEEVHPGSPKSRAGDESHLPCFEARSQPGARSRLEIEAMHELSEGPGVGIEARRPVLASRCSLTGIPELPESPTMRFDERRRNVLCNRQLQRIESCGCSPLAAEGTPRLCDFDLPRTFPNVRVIPFMPGMTFQEALLDPERPWNWCLTTPKARKLQPCLRMSYRPLIFFI